MSGLSYVGADYTKDNNANDVVNKGDVDSAFQNAPVNQTNVQAAVTNAASAMASSTYVNTALAAFVQPNFLLLQNTYTLDIDIQPNPSGTFTLSYGSETTAALPFNVSGTTIQTALNNFVNLFNVVVSGTAGGPYLISLSVTTQGIFSVNETGLINCTVTISPSSLIPDSWVGEYVAPLVTGTIPNQYAPSLGTGYVLGPYGPTSLSPVTGAGSTPVKLADWAIGPTGISHQPMVFMSLLASGANGARPVIDVGISSGQQPYVNQILIARGLGRSCWNDLQAITVKPVPSVLGHTGQPNTGYSPTYNVWISAWVYDANGQSVSVNTSNIVSARVDFWKYQP